MICFSLKSANSALQAEQSVIQSLPEPFWAIVNWEPNKIQKLGLYFTHQNGPIFSASADLSDLQWIPRPLGEISRPSWDAEVPQVRIYAFRNPFNALNS